jgi:hypothetical protein
MSFSTDNWILSVLPSGHFDVSPPPPPASWQFVPPKVDVDECNVTTLSTTMMIHSVHFKRKYYSVFAFLLFAENSKLRLDFYNHQVVDRLHFVELPSSGKSICCQETPLFGLSKLQKWIVQRLISQSC